MSFPEIEKILKERCMPGSVLRDEPLKNHTSFRIGGPAAYFAEPADTEALVKTVRFLREESVPYFIIGNGSNLLVSDEGYPGVCVHIGKMLGDIRLSGEMVSAGAGALLSKIASCARDASLTGFEFASGIPGTFGGACIMNAGAYGGEMKDVLTEAEVLTEDGETALRTAEEMDLRYRGSGFLDRGEIVLSGTIRLKAGDPDRIRERMEELSCARNEKQPLNYPSAGSTFKRPEGYFAGKLISDAELKGFRIGGAAVSEKHAGFIINTGGATAADVRALIDHVQKTVYERFGVELTPEVRFVGF